MNNNRKPAKWSDFDRHLKGDHLQGKPTLSQLPASKLKKRTPARK